MAFEKHYGFSSFGKATKENGSSDSRGKQVTININGQEFSCSGGSIVIQDGTITVDGKEITGELGKNVKVEIHGDVSTLKCSGSVKVHGNAHTIDCGGSCTVGNEVKGSIDAGGSVTCGNVMGDIDAGGSVVCARRMEKDDFMSRDLW